jgi:hypothetical protein
VLTITSSSNTFSNFKADNGAFYYIDTSFTNTYIVDDSSTFTNGYAKYGGVIYCSECYSYSFTSSIFTNNSASSNGGVFYITETSKSVNTIEMSLSNVTFNENNAGI